MVTTQKADIRRFRTMLRQLERIVCTVNRTCCSQVSMTQCHVLLQICAEKTCNIKGLAQSLNLDASTVSRTVDSLVKVQLVSRVENSDDRRSFILSLTSRGADLCEEMNSSADELFGKVIDSIPLKARSTVLKNFVTLVQTFVEADKKGRLSSACPFCATP